MKLFWNDKQWTEVTPEITEETEKIYRLDVEKDGEHCLLEIDCTRVIRDLYGGDIEKFKDAIRDIKTS